MVTKPVPVPLCAPTHLNQALHAGAELEQALAPRSAERAWRTGLRGAQKWRLPRKLRCDPQRATQIARAIGALNPSHRE